MPGPFDAIQALLVAWLIVACAGGVAVLVLFVTAPRNRLPFPPQRRRLVAWTGPLVGAAIIAFYVTPSILFPILKAACPPGSENTVACKALVNSLTGLISLPLQIGTWLLLARACSQRPAFGVVPRLVRSDVLLGYWTWLLISPAVYVVSGVTVLLYVLVVKEPPADHPIIQSLKQGAVSVSILIAVFMNTVIAAPIGEELFFRGILQPFFSDRPWGGDLALWLAAAVGFSLHQFDPVRINDPLSVLSAASPVLLVIAAAPLYRFATTRWAPQWFAVRDPTARSQSIRAVVGTSALFANLHANVWPTPIPLFVLSLGLGWLAFRTQSVVAPIFVHVLFNGIVFAALGLSAVPG